jgi:hypothetical protein
VEASGEDVIVDYKGGKSERGTSSQMESCVHERLLIMERVESLS